ncbi:MAG: hypothetical protein HY043_02910 [Verrucomicrobia bacterium]|nr:hypothetical protein [Verrucomicrobiota bacterium]
MNKRLLLILPALTIARLALADPHLSLAKQSQVLEEGGALTRYSIKTERNEFHFLPPQDWRITVEDEAQKVFFTPRDGSVQFAFKILWAADGKPAKVDVSAARLNSSHGRKFFPSIS